MKQTLFILFLSSFLFASSIGAQEQKEVIVKTEVAEATVFINGAQVIRKKAFDILPGKSKIRLTDLSPYIDAKSVQAKLDGGVMVTSVNHETNYADVVKKALGREGARVKQTI